MSEKTHEEMLSAFVGESAKVFGEGVISRGRGSSMHFSKRLSTGLYALDKALGGGLPWGRIILCHGIESSGKTTGAIKSCASAQNYCRRCRMHKFDCKCEGEFTPCVALWVEQEDATDWDWMIANGYDPDWHLYAKPNCAEDAINLITTTIERDLVDIIVLDSLAACVPTAEIEGDAADKHMGVHARLINMAMRKWVNLTLKHGDKSPIVYLINQEREKIGVVFGDPMTLPGGKGQRFAASVRIKMNTPEITDCAKEDRDSSVARLKGNIPKNKTYIPKLEFETENALRDHEFYKKGDAMNAKALFKDAKKLGITDGHNWITGRQIVSEEETRKLFMVKKMGDPSLTLEKFPPVLVPEVIKVARDEQMIEVIHNDEELFWLLRTKVMTELYQ